jgi:hypothetical protein
MKLPSISAFILVACLGIWLFCFGITQTLNRIERHECLTWQSQEQHYIDFYSPDWAKEQCKQFNINLK